MGFNTSTLWRILTKDRYESNDPPADYKGIVQDIENRAAGAVQLVADVTARNAIPSNQLYAQKRVLTLADGVEWRYIGGSWRPWTGPWTTYYPTVSGISAGSGSSVVQWKFDNGDVRVRGNITLGANGFVNGAIYIGLPGKQIAPAADHLLASIGYTDAGNYAYPGIARYYSATQVVLLYLAPFGGNGPIVELGTTATTPFSWASTDHLDFDFRYEPDLT